MVDEILIKSKMSDIQGYLKELEPLLQEESRTILGNNLKLHTVERLFQLIVDSVVDINTHIIVESSFHIPDDYQSTFITLGENKLLDMEFALQIAPSVGLRNLVVHKYGRVDLKRMIDDIKSGIGDFTEYLKQINRYLERK